MRFLGAVHRQPCKKTSSIGSGIAVGTMRHLGKDDREDVAIELLSSDALSTSAIEGKSSIATASNRPFAGNSECLRHPSAADRQKQALPR
jgi:hypothetical protein